MNTAIAISVEAPKVFSSKGRLVTTSQAVADYFDKQHKHVLEKIRSLDCSPEFTTANFSAVVIKVQAGFMEKDAEGYEITKDGFMFLVMGFTGKKAARLKEAYIAKFNAMETELLHWSAPPAPTYPPFSDDYANRAEIIYYQDFKPIFSRTLSSCDVVITPEGMMEWLEMRGLIFFTRDELKRMTVTEIAQLAG